jgi:hypothetical protein
MWTTKVRTVIRMIDTQIKRTTSIEIYFEAFQRSTSTQNVCAAIAY